MTKKLRYFCTLLLMAVVGVAWAQTYNTVATFNSADVVSASSYAAYSNDDWSLSFGGNNKSVGTNKNNSANCVISSAYGTEANTANNAASIVSKNKIDKVSQITFTYNGGSGNSGKIYLAYSTDNSTWTALTLTSGTQGSDAVTDMTFQFDEIASAYYAVILDRGQKAASNWRWDEVVITFDEKVNTSAVATTTTIDASGITNTDVYVSTEAGSLSATVTETESGDEVSGATVTWTSSKENVATVDENGVVTLVAAGTTTITASYEGVSGEFGASSATYELTVTSSAPYVQPTEFEINMNYEWLGSANGGNLNSNQLPVVKVDDNVTTTITDGTSTRPRGDSDYIRLYKGSTLTFDAPDGYAIIGVEFTTGGNNTWNAPTVSTGTLENKIWSGNTESVVFTLSSGNCFISKVKITLGEPSTVKLTIRDSFTATTFSSDKALDFSGFETLNAYIITDGKGTTSQVWKVPAGEGLYVEGEAGNYDVPILADETQAEDMTGNLLVGTISEPVNTKALEGDYTYYLFGKQNGKEAFFKVGESTPDAKATASAGKAYLAVPGAGNAKEMIVIGGDVTGIESIENGTIVNDNYYTIDGKLVKGQPTQKGIYVVNGRKVVIK